MSHFERLSSGVLLSSFKRYILQVFGRKWWGFYFRFKPCSTLVYERAFCAFRFYFPFVSSSALESPEWKRFSFFFFEFCRSSAYERAFFTFRAYFRFVFCSALEKNEPPPLFFLCLASNAICFQLFKFSGKSGGALTFPSNSADLPHMGERFALFFLCLAPVAYLFESLRKLGESGGTFTFPSFPPVLSRKTSHLHFSFWCLVPNAIYFGILQVFGRK